MLVYTLVLPWLLGTWLNWGLPPSGLSPSPSTRPASSTKASHSRCSAHAESLRTCKILAALAQGTLLHALPSTQDTHRVGSGRACLAAALAMPSLSLLPQEGNEQEKGTSRSYSSGRGRRGSCKDVLLYAASRLEFLPVPSGHQAVAVLLLHVLSNCKYKLSALRTQGQREMHSAHTSHLPAPAPEHCVAWSGCRYIMHCIIYVATQDPILGGGAPTALK